jgi:acyl-CoA thioesterase II
VDLSQILTLTPHGPDVDVGAGPQYPWGGLYGGQIVAQALQAAAGTVDDAYQVHSLRAYFIRRGDQDEPVRYEVDRIRNGRSFCTRRVVARQAVGAILNLEASFQQPEATLDIETVAIPRDVPRPESLEETSWTAMFERRFVPASELEGSGRAGQGRAAAWLRFNESLDDRPDLHAGGLAYLSDDLPTDAVVQAHPIATLPHDELFGAIFSASLDHTIWFHRPVRPDRWHLHDFSCQTYVGGRGLSFGHIFDEGGSHVATVAQEVLLRDNRGG